MKDLVDLVFHPLPSVERLYLELTNRCNLNCQMCYRQAWEEPMGDMTSGLLHKILSELKVFSDLKEIILGGIGEPTIAACFQEAVELFTQDYEVTVTTNGTTLNEDMIDFLLAQGVARIVLSVDSIDDDIFQGLRHESPNLILKNTRLIAEKRKGSKPEIVWEFLAMKRTLPYLTETVRQAGNLGVDQILISHVLPMAKEMIPEILYQPVLPETEDIFRKALNFGLARQLKVVLPKNELKTDRNCKFIETQSTVIRWDGEVSPCYRFLHSYPEYVLGRYKEIKAHTFGSLYEKTLYDIWTTPDYMSYRYKVLHSGYPSCTDCEFVSGCDMVLHADMDCLGNAPSCGDCLWGRGITYCP